MDDDCHGKVVSLPFFLGSFAVGGLVSATTRPIIQEETIYVLKLPVQFYQDTDSHCWAAGAASWLRSTHMGNATTGTLVNRYKDYCDGNGYLVEEADSSDMSVLK